VWADDAGKVVFINRAGRQLFGGDYLGSHISECAQKCAVLRPDGTPYPSERLPLARALLRERVVDEHCRIRKPDGGVVDVLATATPLERDCRPAGAILVIRDVTARLALERTLRLSEKRFRALALATAQMVWTTDANGIVVEDSPSWRAFTGQTVDQSMGRGWLDVVHPDDRQRVADAWSSAVARRTFYEVEYRVLRRDGVYRWVVARGAPLLDEDGHLQEWVGCHWDIHSIKAAQEEQSRISDFQRRLLGIVGHDLRNPMAAILMAATLLLRPDMGPRVRGLADRVRRAAERATFIVDLLLDLTQATLGGGIRLNVTTCDLAAICKEILAEFEGQTSGRKLSLETHGDTRGRWDCARLGQVIANLVSNALQHGTPGTPVHVHLDGSGADVVADVENQALPIPPERLERLFDPFKRECHDSGERRNLGLGLFIVKQLVDAHRGRISVDSDARRTRFRLRLPRSGPP